MPGSLKEALLQALDDDKTATAWLKESKSYTKLNEDVGNAVRQLSSGDAFSYVVELFDDFVVYETGGDGNATKYFKAFYTIDESGKVTLSGTTEVEKVTAYPAMSGTEAGKPLTAVELMELGRAERQRVLKEAADLAASEYAAEAGKPVEMTFVEQAGQLIPWGEK